MSESKYLSSNILNDLEFRSRTAWSNGFRVFGFLSFAVSFSKG